MISNAFGLIYTSETNRSLKDLVFERAVGAVPFGGRYRIIDFAMSNLINSGVSRVGIITQKNYSSLMDHLGSGSAWDLNRKNEGMSILPPYSTSENNGVYRGTIDALKATMDFISHVNEKYCIFMGSHTIYNMTFEKAVKQHIETGADITYIYNNIDIDNDDIISDRFEDVRITQNESGRVVDMEVDAFRSKSSKAAMDCFIIEKTLLEYLIDGAASRGYNDFLRDVVLRRLDTLKVYGYRYDGYVARISSIPSYFKANMDLLNQAVRQDLFDEENRIYTKIKDEVPAQYKSCAIMRNSMAADGCMIEGEVENSILFRGVTIGRNAKVKNCIIMQGTEIGEGATLENVIIDKNAVIRRNKKLIGAESFPIIVRKLAIV